MKLALTLAALLAAACFVDARPTATWTYDKLVADSDLVVVATPTASKDTPGKTVLPNAQRTGAAGKPSPIRAIGIETTFEVLTVFKGDKAMKELTLYHLREAKPENVPNGPQLATFDLKGKRRYLLFLKRESDGRYAVVTGQLDSAVGVKDLGSYP